MTRPYHIFTLLAFTLLISPQSAAAFVVEEQSAIALNEQTALYSITYSTKSTDRIMYYPSTASLAAADADGLQYQVLANDTVRTDIQTRGLIMSDATRDEDQYLVPLGEEVMQTLLVLVTTNEPQSVLDLQVRLHQIPTRTIVPGASSGSMLLRGDIVENSLTPKPQLFGS